LLIEAVIILWTNNQSKICRTNLVHASLHRQGNEDKQMVKHQWI